LAEARRALRNKDQEEVILAEPEFKLPDNMFRFNNPPSKSRNVALNYLTSRAIDETTATEYGIMYNATKLCFPYYEYGEIVYWQTRDFLNKRFEFPDAKMMGVDKSNYVYGFDNAEPNEPVIVVEAIFNAISVGPGAVATGGADIQPGQIKRIKALNPSVVILAPDNDSAGIASLSTNYEKLTGYFKNIQYIIPPVIKDWNDFAKKLAKLNKPTTLIREYIDSHVKPLNMETIVNLLMAQ